MATIPLNGRRRGRAATTTGAAVALCAALMSGCGGSSKAGAGGGGGSGSGAGASPVSTVAAVLSAPRPACGLITQAELEAALGAKVAAGREAVEANRSVCFFVLASGPDQSVIIGTTTSSAASAGFAADRARVGPSVQTVTAGDEAFVAGGQAEVRKGSTSVTLLVALRQAPSGLVPVATKIVQTIASHL